MIFLAHGICEEQYSADMTVITYKTRATTQFSLVA